MQPFSVIVNPFLKLFFESQGSADIMITEQLILSGLGATMLKLELPPMPTFETVEAERLHRKQRLAAAFRLFARYGFDEGIAGHLSSLRETLTIAVIRLVRAGKSGQGL